MCRLNVWQRAAKRKKEGNIVSGTVRKKKGAEGGERY